MYAEERQTEIVGRARSQGRVDVTELAEEFGVTTETVRRDLTGLERPGLVRRGRRGAIRVERAAKAALAEVPEQGAILLDAGTTTGRLAEILPTERELTVVTNSVPIVMTLSHRANLTLLLLGGRGR